MTAAAAFDALIVGGGPAGLSAAIVLARYGLRVGVADRSQNLPAKGETLASAGAVLLRELGVWQAFVDGPHYPCYAYRAIWGSTEVTFHDGLRDPRGHPWMVDRPALIECLQRRAVDVGAVLLEWSGPLEFERSNSSWIVRLGAGGNSLSTRFLIDSMGRAGVVARRLGIHRLITDDQIALLVTFQSERRCCRQPMLVEAVQDGWWYSAESPRAGFVVAFFTDRDLIDLRATRNHEGFHALLVKSAATYERTRAFNRSFGEPPRVLGAGSSALSQVCGEGWIAAGDAALTYDPLSGRGLTLALATGRDARRTYAHRQAIQYASERRWIEHPFWLRRNVLSFKGA